MHEASYLVHAGILAGLKQLQRRLRTSKRVTGQESTPSSRETSTVSSIEQE